MRKYLFKVLGSIIAVAILGVLLWNHSPSDFYRISVINEQHAEQNILTPAERKLARHEYFFRMLRDPATNSIPANIRSRELKYSRTLPDREQVRLKSGSSSTNFSWNSLGPNDVGGRTRALGIDQRNSDIIIAGGVSGGIWKSTDGGSTWEQKTDPNQNHSVTYLVQDPTQPDHWYYSSGEHQGNTASDQGGTAFYHGTGIYKSTDNGESWTQLPATADEDTDYNSEFDYISKIIVNPQNGDLYFASNGFGIYRSADGGSSFSTSPVIGQEAEQQYCDISVASDGTLLAVISEASYGSNNNPGVFISSDDGLNWKDVTPAGFPATHRRSVAAFAPSNPDIVYIFTLKGSGDDNNQGISFHQFKLNGTGDDTLSTEDRSANIPDFGDPVGGINPQGGYNMVVDVKPDNPDFVLVGGVNLFRSTDGFATAPADTNSDGISDDTEADKYWIGGYAKTNNISGYPNQHADQHIVAFDPNNPNRMWAGHDGGLSVTDDVTATSVSWQDKNSGYITTQFYMVAYPRGAGDQRVAGGTQDNGTPYFRYDDSFTQTTTSRDISSGDGAYAHFTDSYIYTSSQEGSVKLFEIDSNGDPVYRSQAEPSGASDVLFIHPYEVDPNDEELMYYPEGTEMWRDTSVTSPGTWESFSAVSSSGYNITALKASTKPEHTLYYGASGTNSDVPKIFRLDTARTSISPTDISIPTAPSGGYVHDIAVNPENADEAVVVMSNYNIVGIYHTTDGGQNWNAIEGNLEGSSSDPGPSIRNATILPLQDQTLYIAGTSTGVYSTNLLDGSNTQWIHEAGNSIGYAVSEYVTSRVADGSVLIGTHGRGIFLGESSGNAIVIKDNKAPDPPSSLQISYDGSSIDLEWHANTEIDLDGYGLYRGDDPDNLILLDTLSPNSTVFNDTGLEDHPHFYRITAIDTAGNESGYSNLVNLYQQEMQTNNNWQFISLPVDASGSTEVPKGVQLYSFTGTYQAAESIQRGNGYWAKSPESLSISTDGIATPEIVLQLQKGWNMIGAPADSVNINTIKDPNNILSSSPVYEYSGGAYDEATEIVPNRGYWIYAVDTGEISMNIDSTYSGSSSKIKGEKNPEVVSDDLQEIIFRSNGGSQSLMVANNRLDEGKKERYRMPPRAPGGKIDVRIDGRYRISDAERVKLDITAEHYPVEIELKKSSAETATEYRLEGISDHETIYYNLKPGIPEQINKEHGNLYLVKAENLSEQLEFGLSPNYPNPFNPSTTIEYRLAEKGAVQMEVFDAIGRRVSTLVDREQQPGRYTVRFDGSNLSSGVYFIRIQAGNFHKIQKMTLIK